MDENNKEKLNNLRHSCAHLLAAAIVELFPGTKPTIGPVIDNGFYYDLDLPKTISEEDLPKIEKKMRQIVKNWKSIEKKEVSLKEAKKIFSDNPYKIELINELDDQNQTITTYTAGNFEDLCRGGHVENPAQEIKAFKLFSIAGAYWRGNEKNKMLTRIYGTAFPTKNELDKYLALIAEAQKRDHRKIGKDLDLFSVSPLTGPGLILWHPRLAISRLTAEQFWREEHEKNGYQFVFTPHIASMDMFVISRHYLKYIDYMFPVMLHQHIEGESAVDYSTEEQLKPMNCPNHIQIYKSRPRSYRELPFRMAELGTVYRYERAGTLHGMTRVRGFTQDDTHIFCRPDQVIDEVRGVIRLTKHIYEIYGFKDYQAYLATRPPKYLGTPQMWEMAEKSLKKALEKEGVGYKVDEGQGVFYGPKIDSKIKDSIGREWQLGTIQVDFNLPTRAETTSEEIGDFWKLKTFRNKFQTKEKLEKYLKKLGRGFNVTFINNKGKEEQAVMIHRTIYGSLERFFGILIEHYAGAFPVWLAPVQAMVIPVADRHLPHCQKILSLLLAKNLRAELDNRPETVSAKIRDAEMQKIPYMLIVGDREAKNNSVSVRVRGEKNLGSMPLDQLVALIMEDIEKKRQI